MSPADRGLQIPERKDAPVVEDPAVVAGKEAAEAEAAYNALPGSTPAEENTPLSKAAEQRMHAADEAFADAPITSAAGALAKMREIVALDAAPDRRSPKFLAPRHFDTVVAFLEAVAGAPSVSVADPAVVALAEYRVAKAADDAISGEDAEAETPEYQATGDRLYAARDAVYDAVPNSMAGMAAKIRFLFDHGERGNDLWPLFDTMAKSMLPLLEGAPAPVPKPDPVVALFTEWGAINEEVMVLSAAIPEGAGANMGKTGHVPGKPWVAPEEREWDAALDRREAVEQKILETPATSMRGVAIKVRLATHCDFETGDIDKLYATPARDIDYIEANGGPLGCRETLISALRDAERLAGTS